ncbi:carboxymuconolactone decarboxylase family protein [Paraburkholderia humisilvae]|nr:carboxymuconolactone decarboxylase family protein [Paraburkholderia humisilvae]
MRRISACADNTRCPEARKGRALSRRDRSLVTVAALFAAGHLDALPAHLHRALNHGVTRGQLAAVITHLAFCAELLADSPAPASAPAQFTRGPQAQRTGQANARSTTLENEP